MEPNIFREAKILIVDDEEINLRLLKKMLEKAGYRSLKTLSDSRQTLSLFDELQPDLILLDMNMPEMDGLAVLQELRPRIPEGSYLPVLVLTADHTSETKEKALSVGAKDFLTKPFSPVEVLLRIRNLVETRFFYLQLQDQNEILEEKVQQRTQGLEQAQIEILQRLALAAEYRDDATGEHTRRVGRVSARLAMSIGLRQDQVDLIGRAAPLHDVGKIGIPDSILLKPGKLTPQEFELMKTHTSIGAQILGGSPFPPLQMAAEIAFTHHERWDGSGYHGMKGESIPLTGRIVAVADSFDAMTHERPYKRAFPTDQVVAEFERESGGQFDSELVTTLLRVFPSLQQEG